jgi:hypothetical protein
MTNIAVNAVNIKSAYIDYLQTLPWTFFITGSTRYELTLKSVRRLMERWYEAICTERSRLFWVAEKFELKDGYHSHGLLHIENSDLNFHRLIDQWQWATGNKAIGNNSGKIEWQKETWNALNLQKYDPTRGAGGYCAKYVLKSNADYDLLI